MIYDKNFDKWSNRKKELNSRDKEIFFHEREVWWCSTGLRAYDSRRLIKKVGKVSDYLYYKTKKAVTRFLC